MPHYTPLADPADHVVGGLDARVRARTNWFVVGDAGLRRQPSHRVEPPFDIHLRFERQTLRRLPGTGAIVFTIRTYLTPLSEIRGRSDIELGLLVALESMSPDERDYHGNHGPARRSSRTSAQLVTHRRTDVRPRRWHR